MENIFWPLNDPEISRTSGRMCDTAHQTFQSVQGAEKQQRDRWGWKVNDQEKLKSSRQIKGEGLCQYTLVPGTCRGPRWSGLILDMNVPLGL